jgi:hypothetical protein
MTGGFLFCLKVCLFGRDGAPIVERKSMLHENRVLVERRKRSENHGMVMVCNYWRSRHYNKYCVRIDRCISTQKKSNTIVWRVQRSKPLSLLSVYIVASRTCSLTAVVCAGNGNDIDTFHDLHVPLLIQKILRAPR